MMQFARLSVGCADEIARGIPWGGGADTRKMIDGKRCIFGGQASKNVFDRDEKSNLALAAKCRAEEAKGSNSFLQRTRRLACPVSYYRSGDGLARGVTEKNAVTKATW